MVEYFLSPKARNIYIIQDQILVMPIVYKHGQYVGYWT